MISRPEPPAAEASAMMSLRTATRLLSGLAILFSLAPTVEALIVGPDLPDRIATHFGWNGVADGWMAKDTAGVVFGTVTLLVVLPLGFLPRIIDLLPDSMINLPNGDFWLSVDRREATRDLLACSCAAFAAGTTAFVGWSQHLLLQANPLPAPPRLEASFGWGSGSTWYCPFSAPWYWSHASDVRRACRGRVTRPESRRVARAAPHAGQRAWLQGPGTRPASSRGLGGSGPELRPRLGLPRRLLPGLAAPVPAPDLLPRVLTARVGTARPVG